MGPEGLMGLCFLTGPVLRFRGMEVVVHTVRKVI